MQQNKEDILDLQLLEESLWKTKTRFDQDYMNRILSPDFFEFGRSGRIYKREETLAVPSQNINAELPLKDFTIHPISKDVVLITYISKVIYDAIETANRSSIWIKTPKGWQLKFHQGTPL